jgi:flagellar basal-body rod modification protein FlgD
MSSTPVINSASDIQMDYMKLLVTELQNQNPLEPMDNNQMAQQLAQFSQLQQLESLNSSFANVLAVTERSYANSLLGRQVSFMSTNEAGQKELATGTVDKVVGEDDGKMLLMVGSKTVKLPDIVSVAD